MHIRGDQTYIGENARLTIKKARIGIISAFLAYGLFGLLDPLMTPSAYKTAWLIRFGIVTPAILIAFGFSYTKYFAKLAKPLLRLLLLIGQMGILAIIYIAKPNEAAFLTYSSGLAIIILWASIMFRLNFIETTFYFISTFILYNAIALFKQDILTYDINSLEYAWYIGNNFLLAVVGILSLHGTIISDKYLNKINIKNRKLISKQKALINAKNKAQESDRLKTAFLTNMSHEIRTPMNGIIGFSELFLDDESTEIEKAQYARIVINSGHQLLQVVNNILDLSKIETNQISLHKRTKDLRIGFKQCIERFSKTCNEKSLKITCNYPENDACYLHTDHVRLFQVINNLIENAIKFTSVGQITFGYQSKPNELLIFVQDTGIGIPKDYQDIIFDRFRQIETSQTRKFSGTGLGLTIGKQLIQLLGGELSLESKENEGSTFYISMPPCEQFYNANQIQQRNQNRLKLIKEKHILIADDETNNFLLFKIYLKDTKIKIGRAKDGKEAIKYVENQNDIDLILMDINMPNTNGIDAMLEIRKINNRIPIIAQAAYVMADDKQKLLQQGFDDYIPKPIESKSLITILAKHLT